MATLHARVKPITNTTGKTYILVIQPLKAIYEYPELRKLCKLKECCN